MYDQLQKRVSIVGGESQDIARHPSLVETDAKPLKIEWPGQESGD